ncbi:MAG: hypothetical protein ABIP39_13205, partial [Polyangiaceae bacterium]
GSAPTKVEGTPTVVPMSGPLARVHVVSPKVVQMYRRAAGTQGWTHACHSPCDVDLPLNDDYRFSGSGTAKSREFRLVGAAGDRITVTVKPTSTGGMITGGVLAGVGGLVMYGSLFGNANPNGAERTQAYTALGVGTIAVAVGSAIMLASTGTGVSQTNGSKTKDAFVREPSWVAPRVAMKRPATLQILSRQF